MGVARCHPRIQAVDFRRGAWPISGTPACACQLLQFGARIFYSSAEDSAFRVYEEGVSQTFVIDQNAALHLNRQSNFAIVGKPVA